MNKFAKNWLRDSIVLRDCCDKPLNCTCELRPGETLYFKLGVLTESSMIYAERASDGCALFGDPCGYKFTIEGRELDLKDVTVKQAIEIIKKTIDDINQPDCLIQDDDDFVV